jgi:hypothetical protein
MRFSLLFAPVLVQAVLHKEFVGAKSDKLLAGIGKRCPEAGGSPEYDGTDVRK